MRAVLRRTSVPFLVFLVATVAFMPRATVGSAVAAPMDLNTFGSPYRDREVPVEVRNGIQTDVNEAQPWWLSFWRDIRHGDWQTWSPNTAGGTPTGTLPLNGSLSPFSWSALVLPGWMAINVRVALLLLVSQGGTYLLARRLGLRRWPAIVAGVAYGFSGTNIVFLLRIGAAALCPLLLWAVHRLASRPTYGRFAATALLVAWVWTEGFPAALVFDLAAAALVAGVVILGDAMTSGQRLAHRARIVLVRGAALGAAVVVGLAIAAVTILPFVDELDSRGTLALEERQYTSADHLAPEAVFGLLDLSATGDPYTGPFFTIVNSFEGISLVGTIVMGGVALAMLQSARGRMAHRPRVRRLWVTLCVALVAVILLTYVGTGLLTLVYQLPGFAGNRFHRARYVIALIAALLAAAGLDAWLDRDEAEDRRPLGTAARWATGALLAALVGCFVVSLDGFSNLVDAANQGRNVIRGALVAGALTMVAVSAVSFARRFPARASVAMGALAVALWVQLAWPMREYIPEVERALFPHRTPGHKQLTRVTDGDRYRFAGSGLTTFYPGGAMLTGGFDLRGLTLQDPDFRRLLTQAAPQAFARDPFKAILVAPEVDFSAPALDHLALRAFVVSTNEEPIGALDPDPGPPARWRRLAGTEVGRYRAPGPIGGVAIPVRGRGACRNGTVTLTTSSRGRELDETPRPLVDVNGSWAWFAITGSALRAGDPVVLSLRSSTSACRLEVGETAAGVGERWAVLGATGPIRLASTGAGWFYERPSAWPLVSIHTAWRGYGDREDATEAVARWQPGDPVAIAGSSSGDPGGTARVRSFRLEGASVVAQVESTAGGLVVVSMNDSAGWRAEVSGRPSPVRSAAGALLAVEVPAGRHEVRFLYRPSSFETGRQISVVALLGLGTGAVIDRRRRAQAGRRAVTTTL